MAVLSGLESALIGLIQNWYLATGFVGIALAMALESCCVPLPSEIVMPLAGYYVAAKPQIFGATHADSPLTLILVALAGTIGCLIGSAVAYGIGAAGGRPLLLRYGRYILISKADSDRADLWFQRHGPPVAFFSRLVPIVRTYISLPAGIAEMNFPQFLIFTFLGSLPWSFALALVGMQLEPALGSEPTELPNKLGGIFHGLDVVVAALLVAGVVLYVYRHIKHDRAARAADAVTEPQLPIRQ
ncbi:MAG TPA: DedA family protein [Ktedonobacterales bacterium]